MEIDLHQFFRRLKLKSWFQDRTPDTFSSRRTELSIKDFGLYNKSDFVPPVCPDAINAYIASVLKEFNVLKNAQSNIDFSHNITVDE